MLIILTYSIIGYTQPLILNDAVFVTMKGGVKIIVNPITIDAVTAIKLTGTALGTIVSEEEFNEIYWWLRDGANNSNIIIPFGTSVGVSTKIEVDSISAGSNDGAMIFATAPTTNDNKLISTGTYPTGVTDVNLNSVDNSANVVDRYWFIKYINYTTKPIAINGFKLSYTDVDLGTITEANLKSQYWNSGWLLPISGTVETTTNDVKTITDPGISAPWILVNEDSPLPIKLLNIDVSCGIRNYTLTWVTSSEINNESFKIDKSYDNKQWERIGEVKGNGNSNIQSSYSKVISYDEPMYVRLKQVDFDGRFEFFNPIYVKCDKEYSKHDIQSFYSDGAAIVYNANSEFDAEFIVLNNIGQIIIKKDYKVRIGTNIFVFPKSYAKGIYRLKIIKK